MKNAPELKPMNENAPRAIISEIGNQIHNLGCLHQADEELSKALGDLATKIWAAAMLASPDLSATTTTNHDNAAERIFISPADAVSFGQKYGHPNVDQVWVGDRSVEYIRADIARPMTVAEAAKVLLDASYADPVGYSELLAEQPLGGIDGLQRSLRAMSQGGE